MCRILDIYAFFWYKHIKNKIKYLNLYNYKNIYNTIYIILFKVNF